MVVVTVDSFQVVATVAGPKSVIQMELYKSNLTEEIQKFVARFVRRKATKKIVIAIKKIIQVSNE